MEDSWTETLAELEDLVVSGQHEKCRERLDSLAPRKTPRAVAAQLAELGSRILHSIYSLKTLHPFVFPDNSFDVPATESEKLQYSVALRNLGATEEALEILQSVDSQKNPEVLFHRALCYFTLWNYPKSIPVLKEFIRFPGVDPYRELVGEVNLAACYVYAGEWELALNLLEKIEKTCSQGRYYLLLGNSFELRAQVFFFQKNYDEALSWLAEGEKYLKNEKGFYLFFVQKWSILCRCAQDFNQENKRLLANLRIKALELGSWETARECDLFQGIFSEDLELIRKVTLGTPSEAYRQRVRKLCGQACKSEGRYEWDLVASASDEAQNSSTSTLVFDPKVKLADKKYLLSLFETLTVDFYKPSYLGSIFKGVYANEKFNPFTSPARVMKLLKRLDQWFLEEKIPLRIHFKKSEFALQATGPIRIVLRRGKRLAGENRKWTQIKKAFAGRSFTAASVSEVLEISKSSAQRLIQKALAANQIQASGRGRSTVYQFGKQQRKSSFGQAA